MPNHLFLSDVLTFIREDESRGASPVLVCLFVCNAIVLVTVPVTIPEFLVHLVL